MHQKAMCKRGHPFTEKNTYVNSRGCQVCIKCRTAYQTQYRNRKKAKRAALIEAPRADF